MDSQLSQDLLVAAGVWGKRMFDLHAEEPLHPGFEQLGMLDGRSIVTEYVEHGELNLAVEHLLYMVHEMGVDWPCEDVSEVHDLAKRVGVTSRYSMTACSAVVEKSEGFRLYLDFDGVLNNSPFLRHQRNTLPRREHRLFDQGNLAALELLCAELPVSSIVVTSTWREGRSVAELRALLAGEGFCYAGLVVDVTGSGACRADEILEHAGLAESSRYLVLDDLNLLPLSRPVFFQVSGAIGLDELLVGDMLGALQ